MLNSQIYKLQFIPETNAVEYILRTPPYLILFFILKGHYAQDFFHFLCHMAEMLHYSMSSTSLPDSAFSNMMVMS